MTRILVIEDSHDLREDIVEILNFEDFEAFGAANGRIGVQMAQDLQPDLILCDIMMPELDGYDVLEHIRRQPKTATIPLIFLTAKTDRIDVRHGMALGADDYITKPYLVVELLDSIHSQLKKRQDLNEAAERRMKELRESIMTALPHELRTPLNTVIGFSEMLMLEAQKLKPDQVVQWANHINVAALRLYRLVENHLYYVRLTVASQSVDQQNAHGQLSLKDIRNLLETEAYKSAYQYAREDDLVLNISPGPRLKINPQDATKIAAELLDNAFKFSDAGQKVCVSGRQTAQGAYELKIENQGRSITSEQVENIGAYMQFDRWLYEQQGMGLGLAIVKLLTEMYQCELCLDGDPERGTTAKVVIPAAP